MRCAAGAPFFGSMRSSTVDLAAEREAAELPAVVTLAVDDVLAFLLLGLALDLGAERYLVAVDLDGDVLLLHAGELRLDAVGLVVLGDVELDGGLGGQLLQPAAQPRETEQALEIAERLEAGQFLERIGAGDVCHGCSLA